MSDQHGFGDNFNRWVTVGPELNGNKVDGGKPAQFDLCHWPKSADRVHSSAKLFLAYLEMQNRSGGTIAVGAGVRMPTDSWVAGSWDNSQEDYTSDTADAQDSGANDFSLEGVTGTGDGFAVGCRTPFNCLAVLVSIAGTGALPTRVVEYTHAAQSGWRAIPATSWYAGPDAIHWVAGEQLVWWNKPTDWAVGTAASHGRGLPDGYYWARVRTTSAITANAASATSLTVHDLSFSIEGLADNIIYEPQFNGMYIPLNPAGEAFVTAWGTAASGNRVTAVLRARS